MDGASRGRTLDRALAIEAAGLVALSFFALWPGTRIVSENSSLDVTLNTLAAIAAAGAGVLAWSRYVIDREPRAVYESAAFIVLALTRGMIVGIAALGQSEGLGISVDDPQQWPLYAWSLARLMSALLLVAAAGSALRAGRASRTMAWVIGFGTPIALLLAFLGLRVLEPSLPPLLSEQGILALQGATADRPGMEPLGLLLQAVIALMYLRGAQLYRRIHQQTGQAFASWLTIALVLAAVSQLHWAFFPGIYRPLVTVDDALRAVFSVIVLLGIEAQSRGDLGALRVANAELRSLRTADAERAAAEAQARFARDVHDGISQELWIARLKHARLARVPNLDAETRQVVDELGEAVGRALDDARSMVASLGHDDVGRGLQEALNQVIDEFTSRSGVKVEIVMSGPIPEIPAATLAELMRIVREALTNVHKHADATLVRLSMVADEEDAHLELGIVDNGRGFDPTGTRASAFGLRGMRERAAVFGGSVEITSRRSDGTRVLVRVPYAAPAPAPALAGSHQGEPAGGPA